MRREKHFIHLQETEQKIPAERRNILARFVKVTARLAGSLLKYVVWFEGEKEEGRECNSFLSAALSPPLVIIFSLSVLMPHKAIKGDRRSWWNTAVENSQSSSFACMREKLGLLKTGGYNGRKTKNSLETDIIREEELSPGQSITVIFLFF